jgi:hypothetical protein
MRRHYANYFRALPDFKPYRTRLVTENDPALLFEILEEVTHSYKSARLETAPLAIETEETTACSVG